MALGYAFKAIKLGRGQLLKLVPKLRTIPPNATQTLKQSADDVAKASATIADDTVKAGTNELAEQAVKSGFVSKNTIFYRSMQITMGVQAASLGLTSIEYATNGALSKISAEAVIAIHKQMEVQFGTKFAEQFKEKGLFLFEKASEWNGVPRNAVINVMAAGMEEAGMQAEADTLRIGNAIFTGSTALKAIRSENGDRTNQVMQYIIENSGVPEERITHHLENNPEVRQALEEKFNVDFSAYISSEHAVQQAPKLAGATEQTPSANTAIRLKEAAGDKLDQAKENGSELMQDFQNASFGQIIFNLVKTLFNAIGLGFIFENETKAEPQGPDLDLN